MLTTADRGRKLMGTVEVETSESVNHLEARSQWAHLGRARAPFHLYVPPGSVDIARRLATENQVNVSEIWSFHTIGDQTHFRLVHRAPEDTRRSSEPRGIVTSARPDAAEARGRAAAARRAGPAGRRPSQPPQPLQPVKRRAKARSASGSAAATRKPRACRPRGEEARGAARAHGEREGSSARKSAPARAQKRK